MSMTTRSSGDIMPLLIQVGVVENAFGIQTHGDIAFAGDDLAALVHPAANLANLETMLFFRFYCRYRALSPKARCGLLPRL